MMAEWALNMPVIEVLQQSALQSIDLHRKTATLEKKKTVQGHASDFHMKKYILLN